MSDFFEKITSRSWKTDVLNNVTGDSYPETLVDPSGKILRKLNVEPGTNIKSMIDNSPSVILIGEIPNDGSGQVGKKKQP